MTTSSSPAASHVRTLNPHNFRTSPYYHLVSHTTGPSNIIYTAGQIGTRPDGSISSDASEQIAQAFVNLKRCLSAAGASAEDVLKLTIYIVDYDHLHPRHRPALLEFLGPHRPPITLVPVPKLALPSFLFEIEAAAAVPQHPTEEVDVVVIGAGLSGLQAAVDLQNAGLKVKVIEARDRVGGKTWSVPAQGSVCDVGAAWINDSSQEKAFALATRLGLELITQNITGNIICDEGIGNHKTHPYAQLLSDDSDATDIEDIIRVRELFEKACQQIDIRDPVGSGRKLQSDLDKITFEQWIRAQGGGESAVNTLTVAVRAMLGVEPSEISALYFLDYCKSGGGYMKIRSDGEDGGQYLRFAKGAQSLSLGLAKELKSESLLLSSPVYGIEQTDDSVRVASARGTIVATRAIVSVPTPLYKEIVFVPPLPDEKLAMSQATKLGDYCKSIVFYNSPWWRKADLCGLVQSCHGPFAATRDTSLDADGKYSLTCFIVGKPAHDWAGLLPEQRRQAVLDQIKKIFSPFAEVEEPLEIVEQIWAGEQFSQGCPVPVFGPGGLTQHSDALRKAAGRIHFVGTETAYEWKGYMDGALRSGERGAAEVIQKLAYEPSGKFSMLTFW